MIFLQKENGKNCVSGQTCPTWASIQQAVSKSVASPPPQLSVVKHRRLLGSLPTFAFKSPVYTTWELLWSCAVLVFWGIKQKSAYLSRCIWLIRKDILGAQWSEHRICCKKNLSNKLGNAKGLNNSLYLHRLRSPTKPGWVTQLQNAPHEAGKFSGGGIWKPQSSHTVTVVFNMNSLAKKPSNATVGSRVWKILA